MIGANALTQAMNMLHEEQSQVAGLRLQWTWTEPFLQ